MEHSFVNTEGTQVANLFVPDHHKTLGIFLSGGTDSTLLVYMICSYLMEYQRTDVSIVLIHSIDLARTPYSKRTFDIISDKFIQEFPELNFSKYVFNYIERKNFSKRMCTDLEKMKIKRIYNINSWFSGKTRNPPKEVCDTIGMLRPALLKREANLITKTDICRMLDADGNITEIPDDCVEMAMSPLYTVDRSFVAEFYHRVEFLKSLFPLTASCVGGLFETKNWTVPCKQCWWCKEKFWAFHQYDGGLI